MRKTIQIILSPKAASEPNEIRRAAANALKLSAKQLAHIETIKRSIDARSRQPKVLLTVEVWTDASPEEILAAYTVQPRALQDVSVAPRVLIIGSGPAGLFAALRLIELGFKPILLERGKDVRARRRDLALINREGIVDPDSNYAFGEGGAGTYSDGKLYTRSDKRGNVQQILETFVSFGAERNILVEAHPHIGTNKLPEIIARMREAILGAGGEVHFETRLTDIDIVEGSVRAGIDQQGIRHDAQSIILATGHSARDIFTLLESKKIAIEAKPFALGVRIEHPQSLIDSLQYHCADRGEYLPPAAYSWVEQVEERGVYSFCMCPGGVIAPCATTQEEIVTNGWSPSKRNNPFANSGIVVSIERNDLGRFTTFGNLAMMEFQRSVEHTAWDLGGRTQHAPAQRLVDFVEGRNSPNLPQTSYKPGVTSVELREVLPPFVAHALSEGLRAYGKKRPAYFTNEAVLVAPESRTSSPVRIPREPTTLMHPEIEGLYPSGEGAGYAGGIVSAAMDGERVAEACANWLSLQ